MHYSYPCRIEPCDPAAGSPPDGRSPDAGEVSHSRDGHVLASDAVSCRNSAPSRHAVRMQSRMWTGRTPVCGR